MPEPSRSSLRALKHIRYTPGITRHELAEVLGVTNTTVNPLISQLIDQKLVHEVIPTKSERQGVGRPRAGLEVPGLPESIAVLVWGHGVLERAIVTFGNQIVWRRRTPVEGVPTADDLVTAGRETLDAATPLADVRPPRVLALALPAPYEPGVGLGRPGGDEPPVGFGAWFNEDPRALLAEELGIPVIAENDANLGALGETRFGAGAGETTAIYVKLSGRGIGAGLTVRGELFSGSHGFAGEIAHVRVDDDSQVICSCGSRGCLEEKIGPNMLRQLHANYGSEITYADLLDMIERGVPGPTRLLQDAGRVAGRALADMCTFFNPGVLVLDAGSATASAVLIDGVREQVEQSAPPFVRRGLRIVPTQLGEDAPILGSVQFARLALRSA